MKEDVSRWQSSLRSHGSADWLIIVVDGGDARKKNKSNILPRSSIVDKIRGDFCNKQNDRSAQRAPFPPPRRGRARCRLE